ncbi:hypothetical protein AURDEDRAFT_165843 [Auricularia subglabra TFB-10046 SS5]|nr:hypothetical protein AURDEDRAFT_165843 [Auricularia subglabra TFB-10046 SS5]
MSARPSVSRRGPLMEVNVVQYAEIVWPSQLADPHSPQCCPLCFAFFVRILVMPETKPILERLLDENHAFFDACARMLTAPRGAEDLPRLQRLLKENTSRCSKDSWHRYVGRRPNYELNWLVYSLFNCLMNTVVLGPREVKRSSTFSAKSRKGSWPTALQQLLPYGAQESVVAYVLWCHTLIDPQPFVFLYKLLEIARPTVLPHLLDNAQRQLLVEDLLRMLRCTSPRATPAPKDKFQIMAGDWLRDPRQALVAVVFLTMVDGGPGAELDDIILFYAGFERAVLDGLLEVADAGIIDDGDTLHTLTSMASTLHAFLGLPDSELHPAVAAYRAKVSPLDSEPTREQQYTPGQFVGLVLGQYVTRRACAGPGCAQTAISTGPDDPGKLRACSRCHFIRYCSRGCQQADWRGAADGERVSHKALCPILCKLWDAGASVEKQTTKEFSRTFDRAGIEPSEFQTLHLWAWTSGVVSEGMRPIIFGNVGRFIALWSSLMIL